MTDGIDSAVAAGLHYLPDVTPGIRRRRAGRGFYYLAPGGEVVRDAATLQRIKSLAIPPAWKDVWISPDSLGHLQATGIDARGRKQYRYHAKWREVRDAVKYDRMVAFGEALPAIREHTDKDLALRGMPREKVLATVVRLLETTRIRVGNDEYRRENKSFGLTTLRTRHVNVEGSKMTFSFRGKRGKQHSVQVTNRRLARVVRQCLEIPGYELFQYIDEEGKRQSVDSGDVNRYLKEISGGDFTAKDFRTWAGTVLMFNRLRVADPCQSERQGRVEVAQACAEVAERLGNTPAICRKSYIHPVVVDAYLEGTLPPAAEEEDEAHEANDLSPQEQATLSFLRSRMNSGQTSSKAA